jgi:hypothetical protein
MNDPLTHYMIVFKPLTSKCWTPLTEDSHPGIFHPFTRTNWSSDLLHVRKMCQYLNGLGLRVFMCGLGAYDRLVFRVATVQIADSEDVALPKGDKVEA